MFSSSEHNSGQQIMKSIEQLSTINGSAGGVSPGFICFAYGRKQFTVHYQIEVQGL